MPQIIPRTTPKMSATQSLMSALRLKVGWMSSIVPPKALAPTKTGSNPKRPVLERGKESVANAMRCTTLSLPSGAGGGASKGQSMATVRMLVTIRVRGMSRYRRIRQGYWSLLAKASAVLLFYVHQNKRCFKSGIGSSDKLKIRVALITLL